MNPPALAHALDSRAPESSRSAAERTVKPVALRSGGRKLVLLSLGSVSLVMGLIGILVPLWPTTCFLLGATWCFSRSSTRLDRWMHNNRWFGAYLTDYRRYRTIPIRLKTGSITLLWTSIGVSIALATPPAWLALGLLAIGLSVTVHIARLNTVVVR